ncbi:MAG: Hpt domain-containing protein [Bacteroidota bacterium]
MSENRVINKEEFKERVEMLSPEVMTEVIEIFKDGYPERKENIQNAMDENSARKLEFEIHALKNDLSQFAANDLFEATEALLTKVRRQNTTDIATEIDQLENTIEQQLIPELDNWNNENN